MRVISQNGEIDVPYELTAFHSCNGRIRMNMAGDTGRGTEMAVYSSQEKALTVMGWMRDTYRALMNEQGQPGLYSKFIFPPSCEVRI